MDPLIFELKLIMHNVDAEFVDGYDFPSASPHSVLKKPYLVSSLNRCLSRNHSDVFDTSNTFDMQKTIS